MQHNISAGLWGLAGVLPIVFVLLAATLLYVQKARAEQYPTNYKKAKEAEFQKAHHWGVMGV